MDGDEEGPGGWGESRNLGRGGDVGRIGGMLGGLAGCWVREGLGHGRSTGSGEACLRAVFGGPDPILK